jgi:hypothetical protein
MSQNGSISSATRYDKLAANYLAFIQLASIRLWVRVYEFTGLVQIGYRASRLARSWLLTGHFAVTA